MSDSARVVVLSASEQLSALCRVRRCACADPRVSTLASVVGPLTRLLLIGPDVPAGDVSASAATARGLAPGIFVAHVVGEGESAPRASAVDTTLRARVDQDAIRALVEDYATPRGRRRPGGHGRRLARAAVGLAVAGALWQAFVQVFRVPTYLLPAPTRVLLELGEHPTDYLLHLGITASEAALGFVAGSTIGLLLATAGHRYEAFGQYSAPLVTATQSVPIVVMAPLLVIWLGPGLSSKVAMATIICFFPVAVGAGQAFASVDRDARDLFRLYRASYWVTLRHLVLPASMPAIVASLRVAAGLAVVGAIVAELTGASQGLGFVLLGASYRLETERLFAAMLLATLLGASLQSVPLLVWGAYRAMRGLP